MDGNLPDSSTVYHTRGRSSFDLHRPPADPPHGCVDPALWQLAYALHVAHRPAVDGHCACGDRHPCEAWWQAVAGLSVACAAVRGAPRSFLLCDSDGDIMAYGMTLPDGSAVTVQWAEGTHGSVGLWSSPGAPARLWSCLMAWFDRPVAALPQPS